MATPRLGRTLTCPNCFGRLPLTRPAASITSPLQLGLTQVRHARTLTKAELEDLQGIPVRLLKNIVGFGKQNAIIRVKAGRMRNQWHHKGLAEYMTKKRFDELGLTESAIGTRDRSFGKNLLVDEDANTNETVVQEPQTAKRKEIITMTPDESRTLLQDLLPETIVFARKPIVSAVASEPAADPEPTIVRSPSLSANAQLSTQPAPASPATPEVATPQQDAKAIFGSVSSLDVLTRIREALLADRNGSRVTLEVDGILIHGLDAGEDRIKRLGMYEVEIITGKGMEPVRRALEVVAEAE